MLDEKCAEFFPNAKACSRTRTFQHFYAISGQEDELDLLTKKEALEIVQKEVAKIQTSLISSYLTALILDQI